MSVQDKHSEIILFPCTDLEFNCTMGDFSIEFSSEFVFVSGMTSQVLNSVRQANCKDSAFQSLYDK